MRPNFSSFLLSFYVLMLIVAFASIKADDEQGTNEEEEEIVVPWKKLYRPRGPPRFGKRAFVLLDDETVPVAWRKRLS